MDVRITWVIPPGTVITDQFNVLYKEADATNLNNWIIANPSPLPWTAYYYDITGLNPNTVYRFAVTKTCPGSDTLITQCSWYATECPIISLWQGPPVYNTAFPTLFYSTYYPNSTHVARSIINSFDATVGNSNATCDPPLTTSASPVGRQTYSTINTCIGGSSTDIYESCNTQELDLYPTNSSLTSAAGYYGLDGGSFYDAGVCGTYSFDTIIPAGQDPIIYAHRDYKFTVDTIVQDPSTSPPPAGSSPTLVSILGDCVSDNFTTNPGFTLAGVARDYIKISGSLCYDNCEVKISLRDGTNQTRLSDYTFEYYTQNSTGLVVTLPLVNALGAAITTPDVTYDVYCPIVMSGFGALTNNIKYVFSVYIPGVTPVRTVTGLNLTGYTVQQVVQFIANDINTNTAYGAQAVQIGGVDYIKITPCAGLVQATVFLAQIFEVFPGNFVEVAIATCSGYTHDLIDIKIDGTSILIPAFSDVTTQFLIEGYTFGQYKVTTQAPGLGQDVAYWNTLNYNITTGDITVNPNETIEFTQFSYTEQLVKVENTTSGMIYDITNPLYINSSTLPTFNTLNSIPFFAIKADYVNLNPGDNLVFTFSNSVYPTCQFNNYVTVNF